MTDLAVLGQDPRFAGGSRVQAEAFWRAAVELGREPTLFWLSYRGLDERGAPTTPLHGHGLAPLVPGLDGVNQVAAARRVVPELRRARSVWVVSTVASHGYGAALAGRRYGLWVGTSLDDEWTARRPGLGAARRAALALSARTLRRLERETVRRAARVYATSPASRAGVAAAAGVDPPRIELLPIPVDTSRFAPLADDEWRAALDPPTLVFVGRGDDSRKNLQLLLAAFAEVRRRIAAARLLLIGPSLPHLHADGVEAAGEVEDVAPLLRQAALLVLPSLQEGFGIVAAEALACGVPVVSTPSGGPEDLLRRSGGGRVLAGFGAAELAATLVELLEQPASLLSMRAAGREHIAREHAPERFRERLAAALRDVDEA